MNKNGGEGLMSTLLFKHVNVVDVRNQQILSDVDVWIKNERIEKIGRDIKSSADQVVDGEGKYLSPGIIDMHVHSTWDGSAISEDMDEMYGPYQAFLRSVHNVENVPSIGTIANTKDELLYAIREKKTLFVKKGIRCQWIKIMDTGGAAGLEDVGPSMYDLDQLKFIVHEAHRLHMKVAVHAVSQEGIIECIKAGIDTIEHGPDIPDEYLDMMKEKGLTLVPTLAIYKILSENKGVLSDFMVERSALVTRQQKSTFARAMEKGVKIALGTDAGSPCFGSQPSAFKEMLVMQDYGMPPEKIISSATLTSAEVLGMSEEIGTIEPGKIADLVLLGENPYTNLKAYTDCLIGVYKSGEMV